MILTPLQIWIIIGVITIGTMITRFLPFIIFPESKEPPKFIMFLSDSLPPAMMGLLVVYSLKDTDIFNKPYGIPELIALVITAVLHKWKGNVLLSILVGTISYMLLIHCI